MRGVNNICIKESSEDRVGHGRDKAVIMCRYTVACCVDMAGEREVGATAVLGVVCRVV